MNAIVLCELLWKHNVLYLYPRLTQRPCIEPKERAVLTTWSWICGQLTRKQKQHLTNCNLQLDLESNECCVDKTWVDEVAIAKTPLQARTSPDQHHHHHQHRTTIKLNSRCGAVLFYNLHLQFFSFYQPTSQHVRVAQLALEFAFYHNSFASDMHKMCGGSLGQLQNSH